MGLEVEGLVMLGLLVQPRKKYASVRDFFDLLFL